MTTETIDIPIDTQTQLKEIETEAAKIESFKITNALEYSQSAGLLKTVKTMAADVEARRVSMTKPLDESKKRIMDHFRPTLDRLAAIESTIKAQVLMYQREQERLRAEAQAKALAVAQAEERRQREIKEKQQREWEAREATARAEAEKLAAAGHAEESARARAEADRAAVKAAERAEQAEAVVVMAPVIAAETPSVTGISTRKIWMARIDDVEKIPANYYLGDEKVIEAIGRVLNRFASATKGAVSVPGVKFYSEDLMSVRKDV